MDAFYQTWQPCLGRVLRGAKVRLLDPEAADGADVAQLALAFGEPELVRLISCKQAHADWALVVDAISGPGAEMHVIDAKDHPVLAPFLGRIHTAVQLFVNADRALKAMAFRFGKQAFAFGVGRREWSTASGALAFKGFRGEALSLWTMAELDELLCQHPLELDHEIGVA